MPLSRGHLQPKPGVGEKHGAPDIEVPATMNTALMEDISIMLVVRGKESAKEKVSYFALL